MVARDFRRLLMTLATRGTARGVGRSMLTFATSASLALATEGSRSWTACRNRRRAAKILAGAQRLR